MKRLTLHEPIQPLIQETEVFFVIRRETTTGEVSLESNVKAQKCGQTLFAPLLQQLACEQVTDFCTSISVAIEKEVENQRKREEKKRWHNN